ncbi:MAG: exopolysaccharide biosynthesis polyprenyl glycosylphosphotransferase [Puniceicoccaceae bacterium]|nr:MAG: exopolysaccharide biosynthesis polyprenyl glycosylphosphotransferase [Puniceicoccaceae bacterium]
MIFHRLEGIRILKVWILAGVAFCGFWIWYGVYMSLAGSDFPALGRYFIYSLLVSLAIVFERVIRDRSQALAPAYRSAAESVWITLRQVAFAFIAVALYTFLMKDGMPSRAFFLTYFAGLPFLMLGINHLLFPWLTRQVFSRGRRLRTVLIGNSASVRSKLGWFQMQQGLGLELIGYVENGDRGEDIDGLPHLGSSSRLSELLAELRPASAVFVDPPERYGDLIQQKILGDKLGIRIVHIWDVQSAYGLTPSIHLESGMQFLGFRAEPLESPVNRTTKRIFDICVSLPICLFVLPLLCAVVWLAHRLQSPGPLFYVQERQGAEGSRFEMLKFRSMHVDNPNVSKQATRDDARVFSFGRFIRRFSIDEFPQFINVLQGEMSIVGPRPHLPEHDLEFATVFQGYAVRQFAKPGITGLAQVRGYRGLIESDEDVRMRAESDIHYLEHWSIVLDASIVLRTGLGMVFPNRKAF